MPRDYGKVNHRFWSGDTGKAMRSMSLEVRVVAGYLMTCGSSNMIGLYYLPLVVMVYEIGSGITMEGALKALRSLEGLGFAYYDDANETVFVPTMARRQIGDSLKVADKQRLGVIALLQEYKKSKYYNEFLKIYRDAYSLSELPFNGECGKTHGRPIEGPSKPEIRDQEQEQEQDGEPLKVGTVPPEPDRPFLPDTPDRLVACIKAAVEKARPERGFWDPGAKGSFVHQDAAEFLRGLGDIDFVAPEVMRRIQLFAKDDRMSPWTFAKFRREYNGIGVNQQRQATY